MFVENFLLPRFLILELVLACHYFQFTKACLSISSSFELCDGKEEEDVDTNHDCQINLAIWQNQPLLLSDERNWMWPGRGQKVHVGDGEKILVSCPGSGVNSTRAGTKNFQVSCDQGLFKSNIDQTGQFELANHGCKASPRDTERKTSQLCGPNQDGELVKVGFLVEKKFLPILSYCHNGKTENTYYSEHILYGSKIQFIDKEEGRPAFKEGKLYYKSVSASSLYSKRYQNLLFARLAGSSRSKEILSKNYLARGHLAPDADFVFKEWQDATYYYGNAVPQWQSINNGNWKQLESSVREKAEKDGKQLLIRTGSFGVMELAAAADNNRAAAGLKEVWLSSKDDKTSIPVPKYLFKTITNTETNSTIAILSANNPLLPRVTRSTILCEDVCIQTGWAQQFNHRDEIERGIVFCCSPQEFAQILPWPDFSHLKTHSPLHF